MPTVTVVDLANLSVDGTPAGSVTDVLANYADVDGIRSAVLDALNEWHAAILKAHYDELAAKEKACELTVETLTADHVGAIEARDAKHAEALDVLKQAQASRLAACKAHHAKELATTSTKLAAATTQCDEQKTVIDALGGTELGRELARKNRCKLLHEQKAAIVAELAKIDANPTG